MRLSSGNGAVPAAFTNAGTVTWLGGVRLYAYDNSQIVNLGRWELAEDGLAQGHCCSGAGATFLNRGTLVKTGGAGITTMETFGLQNEGTVAADTGILRFPGNVGSEWRAGGRIAGSGRVQLENGNATLAGLTTLNGIFEWTGDGLDVYGLGELAGPIPLEWVAGKVRGSLTIATNGAVNLRGGSNMRLSSDNTTTPAVITNRGIVTWSGGVRLYVYFGSQIYNEGEWRLAADGLAFGYCCGGAGGTFHNRGLLAKIGGDGTTRSESVTIRNLATVNVASGTLQIDDSSIWEDGGRITGAGRVLLQSGSTTLAGTTTLNASWQWAGVNVYGTGVVSGPIPMVWRSGRLLGSLAINPGAQLDFTGEYYPWMYGSDAANPAILTNRGTVTWNGGYPLYSGLGALIYNYGQWRLTADGTALALSGAGPELVFNNFGTFTKSGGVNETVLDSCTFSNRAVVSATSGTLRFASSSVWENGGQIAGSGRVLMYPGSVVLNGTTLLNGSWQWAGVNIYGTGVVSGPIPLVWRSGRMFGNLTVNPGAQLDFTGEYYPWMYGSDADNPAILTNRGTVTWNGGYSLYGGLGARVYNYGAWRLTADGTALEQSGGGSPLTFHNFGSFAKSGGTNETIVSTSTFTNRAIVSVASGTLRFTTTSIWENGGQISGSGRVLMYPGSVVLNGTTLLNGSWQWAGVNIYGTGVVSGPIPLVWRSGRMFGNLTVNPGAQLDFSGEYYPWMYGSGPDNPTILTNRGTVTWNGGYPLYAGLGAQVYNQGQWRLGGSGTALDQSGGGDWGTFNNTGTLLKTGEGEVTIGSFVVNSQGRITAEAGRLNINNPLADSGELHFPLRGPVAGTDYGVIRVNGAYSHQGKLHVEFGGGFEPGLDDSFDLVTGNNLIGNFAALDLPTLTPDLGWTLDYYSTLARLRVTDACLANGLVGWWSADGGAADLAGLHQGTLVNGASVTNGFVAQAFVLDGVNDYVDLGNWSPGTRWTLQAWVNLREIQPGRRTILGGMNQNLDWGLTATDGYLGLTYRPLVGNTTTLTNVTRAQTNVWYHLAGTCDGTSVAFYLNGVLIGTAPSDANYVGTSTGVRIGAASYSATAENFAGRVDEATIHNRPQTGAEIVSTFNQGAAGRCSQLGLGVLTFAPAGLVTSNVTLFTIRFNQPFNTNTFTAADLAVTGPGGAISTANYSIAASVPFDGRTFLVSLPPLTAEGAYSVSVGPNIQTLTGATMAGGAFTGTFTIDKTAPRVIAFSPTSPVSNQVTTVDATFSEAISGATVQTGDLVIEGANQPAVISATQTATNRVVFQLSRALGQGAQTLRLGTNITDLAGNSMSNVFSVTLTVETPDLAPVNLDAPGIALAGQATALFFTVTNAGTATAPGGWRANFLMSTNGGGSNAVLLGTAIFTNTLAPRTALVVTQALVIPPAIVGTRFLGVQLDALNALVEGNELNNIAWAPSGTTVSAPDLVITNLTAPATATLGAEITVTWTRRNIGSAPTYVTGQDRVFLSTSSSNLTDARLLASLTGELLAAGGELVRTERVTIPLETSLPAGSYFIVVAADSPDAQAESNEGNNLRAVAITLAQPPLPDLAVLQFSPPTRLIPGSPVDLTWTVTNSGTLGLTNLSWVERVVFSNALAGRITLGDFRVTNSLAVGAALTRTQAVAYPSGLPAEPGWLQLTVDAFDTVVESSEANNSVSSDTPVVITPKLSVEFTAPTLSEGTGIQGRVRRDGGTNSPVTVTFTNSHPARLLVPAQVTLPAGVSVSEFTLQFPENGTPEGTFIARIGVEAEDYLPDYTLLTLIDESTPALILTVQTNRVREGFTVATTVSRGVAGPEALDVFIGVADPLSLTVPPIVTIPANQAAFTFAILAKDDTFFNGMRTNSLRAGAVNFTEARVNLTINDDDLPGITLELVPAVVPENAGPQAASLNIRLSTPAPRNVVLDLVSSAPSRARVPSSVTIPAGQTAASVPVEVIDNQFFGANDPVDFQGLIHEAGSFNYIGQTPLVTLSIRDDEGPALSLRLDHDLVDEGLPAAASGTVSRNGSTAAALVVTLASSDTTEATVPASVTILAGQSNAVFQVASIADGTNDGAQRVSISASATGFTAANVSLTVSDLDLPDYRVARITIPASGTAEATFNVSYRIENQGRATGGSNLFTKVYLRTDPLAFGGVLVGTYTLPAALPPGQFFEQSLQGRFPQNSGRYYIVVQTDADGRNAETLEDNNLLVSAPIQVVAPWTATVQTPVTVAPAGTPIPMTGQAVRSGGSPVANALVTIHISRGGIKRTIAAFTDATGHFSATFTPLPGEAGTYEIGAAHPGEAEVAPQDSFNLIGLRLSPSAPRVDIKEGQTATGSVEVGNLGTLELTGLNASVISGPPGWTADLNLSSATLPGAGTNTLGFTVTPDSSGIGTFVILVTANGGVTNYLSLVVAVEPLRSRLVVEPGSLFAGMVRGAQTIVNFDIVNLGGLASGPLNVSLPNLPWLRVASPNPMPSLAPNETNKITLLLSPPADLELVPFDGALQLVAPNGSLNVPFQFRALSEAKGDLRVKAVDELTYYAEGAPLVTNATVTLRDPVTHDAITNLNTGANGFVDFPALPEGYYEVEVLADKHSSFRGNTFVTAGRTNEFEVFTSLTLVQYIWTVTPTEIEDRTRITIETVFETVVPLPVVTIEPAYIDLSELPEPEAQVEFRITNHGLIAAKNVALELPTGGSVTFESVASDLGDLPAQSSITIPVRIRQPVAGFSAAGQRAGLIQAAGPITVTRDRCYYYARERHEIPCGKRTNVYYSVTAIQDKKAQCGGSGSGGPASGQGPQFNGGPLSPCGTTSGPGGNSFAAPRRIQQDEKCGCEGFVPECWELGGGVGLPDLKLGRYAVSLKASGSGKWCSCCDEDGKGTKKEFSASLEGALKVEIPLGPGVGMDASFSSGPFSFHGRLDLGGAKLDLSPKLKGEYTATEDCHGKNQRTCYSASAEAPVEVKVELGPKFEVFEGGNKVGEATAQAVVSLKSGFSAKRAFCNDGSVDQTVVCILPVVASANLTLKFKANGVESEFSTGRSVELVGEQCNTASAASFRAAAGGNAADQIAEELRRAIEQAVADFERNQSRSGSFVPASAPRPAVVTAANGSIHAAGGDGVCARVALRIEQDLVMTRNAFDATLELINRDPVNPLTDILVRVQVFDAEGHDVTERFGQRSPVVSGLGAVDGTGSLNVNSSGRASFILVPTSEAAPEGPTVYFVGGVLGYRVGGTLLEIPLAPAPITVLPDPRLRIKYFHQRDVLSDDPFTRNIIEPTIPYSLAVMVQNVGRGEAKNVRLISGQPKIIENERGLLIDFKIIATEVAGRSLSPSLTADFGRIAPGQISIGRWLLTSTLQGLFIDYKATFEHLDSLGKTNLSLIDEVTIHEMIRMVQAGGIYEDGKPDFLVNDDRDPDDMPDHLYMSDGSTNLVSVVRSATADGAPAPGDFTVALTADMPSGWTYLRVPDPANGAYRLARVTRSDGRQVAVDTNAWQTDRTFIGRTDRPIRENILHLLDYDSTGSYTLTYEFLPPDDFTMPESSVTALPAFSTAQIPVSWTGADFGGGQIVSYDIYVAENRGPFIPWLQGVAQQAAIYEGTPGKRYEFYSLATDTSGNREAPPLYADAQTVVGLSNNAPTLTLNAPAEINEGQTLVITATATDPEMPAQSLLFTLLAGPPGAVINPSTGRIEWLTGEGNGPGTNLFRVSVRDNGLPPLSATSQVSVVVREINSAPVILTTATRTTREGLLLVVTNTAFDGDLPVQSLAWSLGAGAPAGATIDAATGIFRWRPSSTQGGKTNALQLIVRDNGSPVLSATQTWNIIVRDTLGDFRLSLGRTNVFRGETSSVPVRLSSGVELSDLRFTIETPIVSLANFTLTPVAAEVSSATLTPEGTNRSRVTLTPAPDEVFLGDSELARLGFTALPAGPSLILPLLVKDVEARRSDGSLVNNTVAEEGRVIIVGEEPLLEAHRTGSTADTKHLTLYGRPGRSYEIQSSALNAPVSWTMVDEVQLTAPSLELFVPGPVGNIFYRAAQTGSGGGSQARLEITRPGTALILHGRAGASYTVEFSSKLGTGAQWLPVLTVSMTNTAQALPAQIRTNATGFYRVREP